MNGIVLIYLEASHFFMYGMNRSFSYENFTLQREFCSSSVINKHDHNSITLNFQNPKPQIIFINNFSHLL